MKIWVDGSVRGNPGKAAWAYVAIWGKPGIESRREAGQRFSERSTNNVAEYEALLHALHWAADMFFREEILEPITVYCDSKLIVEQVNGNWKVKHEEMKHLHQQAAQLMNILRDGVGVELVLIPRSMNTEADALVNEIQDGAEGK
jgi:ribonuclease HI